MPRPALERLRDVAYAGAIDRLYVHSPDRLARKYAYQVLLIEEFKACGVEVIFLNRAIGKTPEDDLLLQLQGMIAEYELAENLVESKVPDAGERVYSFADLHRAADARGEIAIGIRRTGQDGKPGGGVQLNPGGDVRLRLSEDDEIIVLTSYC